MGFTVVSRSGSPTRRENQKRRVCFRLLLRLLRRGFVVLSAESDPKMPNYSIRGINVEFPFEAYQSQIIYMDRVIESLQNVGFPLPLSLSLFYTPTLFNCFVDDDIRVMILSLSLSLFCCLFCFPQFYIAF